jgi:glycosyltransferase involved in cell wall biosynthesis
MKADASASKSGEPGGGKVSRPAPGTAEPFSLLLPVYAGDQAGALDAALLSATAGQTLPPSQVVLVQDGPVDAALAGVLDQWAQQPEVTLVRLPENRGIAAALNAGLTACRYGIVARLDADDVALPDRFAAQVPLVAGGLDVVGGALWSSRRRKRRRRARSWIGPAPSPPPPAATCGTTRCPWTKSGAPPG